MFTAPIIPIAVSYRSQEMDEDLPNGFDGPQPVAIVSRPPNVIGSVPSSFNTIPGALQVSCFLKIYLRVLNTQN